MFKDLFRFLNCVLLIEVIFLYVFITELLYIATYPIEKFQFLSLTLKRQWFNVTTFSTILHTCILHLSRCSQLPKHLLDNIHFLGTHTFCTYYTHYICLIYICNISGVLFAQLAIFSLSCLKRVLEILQDYFSDEPYRWSILLDDDFCNEQFAVVNFIVHVFFWYLKQVSFIM